MMKFPASRTSQASNQPQLMQEEAGFYLGIGANLEETGQQAAATVLEKYTIWRDGGRHMADTEFKGWHFCIAVGGGNTIKAVYRALLNQHAYDINWIEDVRFFFLEESTGEKNWTSAAESLVTSFIRPLASKLVRRWGVKKMNRVLGLQYPVMEEDLAEQLIEAMLYRIDLSSARKARRQGKTAHAGKLTQRECERYHTLLRQCLGKPMAFHLLITGVGKDGELGAFSPYTDALEEKKPGLVKLKQDNGATRIALNRGIITRAECVALILSGSRKLKALGRFEMQEAAEFEQTVMETPVRMLRERRKIAEKVYIFADDTALHFDEEKFQYRENGKLITTKAEVRLGSEENGIHIFLLHGFMGLYSYVNFLIRLPGAWTVSALHRGKHAKKLAAKKAAAEAAANDALEPAPVPPPPVQSSDDESLIELPIAPTGSRQDESEETIAPGPTASEGAAVVSDNAEELQSLRVLFPAGGIGIDTAAESELIRLAGYLNHNQAQRVVLRAHAGDSDQGSSHARRLSLSRALAIRTFLVDRGVPVDRIYLRPLGSEFEDGPPDRVDILPLRP